MRYLGSSNFTGLAGRRRRLDRAGRRHVAVRLARRTSTRLLERDVEDEVVPACEHVGVGLLPVLPARLRPAHREVPSRRAGRPRARASPGWPTGSASADWDTIEALEAYAAQRGLRPIDVAIGGLAAQPAVASVIAGATRPEQVVDNVRAGLWEPTAEDLAELDADHHPAA